MDVNTARDAFIRAAKKQRVSSYKTQEIVGRVGRAIEQALEELQSSGKEEGSSQFIAILTELRNKVNDLAPVKHIEGSQKESGIGFNRYTKVVEKDFHQDISKALRNVDWDLHTVNWIIACHFYQEGLFDVGDCFMNEAGVQDVVTVRSQFLQLHQIIEAMRSKDLKPALSWAASQHDQLLQNGSDLGLKLHRLEFLEKVQKGSRFEALEYAKSHLAPFASTCKNEIQKLMACLLWVGRLDKSPYADFTSPAQWEKLAVELTQQFCNLNGQASKSPLSLVLAAGLQALPILLKMASVAAVTGQNWQEMKQLPSSVDLPDELLFHSVFVCPVLWERSTEKNPPMMLPCGHVLSKQAIVKMAKSSTRHFKCPYCPDEATLAQCRQLYF